MKTPLLICAGLILAFSKAQAWGTIGHKSTALIAEAYLSPKAKAAVSQLLQGQRLVDVANWADSLRDRPEYAHTIPYHYQNTKLPSSLNINAYKENLIQLTPRERQNYRPGVVEAIAGSEEVLTNPQSTWREKQIALKFLVHFVGDLHQPLHTGLARNHGGNPIQLNWQGDQTNLHKVWDSEIIYDKVRDLKGSRYRDPSWAYAQWVLDNYMDSATTPAKLGTVANWYHESLSFQKTAYDSKYLTNPQEYEASAGEIIDMRILTGGRRLGEMLNRIFADEKMAATPNQQVIQFAEKMLGSLGRLVRLRPQPAANDPIY